MHYYCSSYVFMCEHTMYSYCIHVRIPYAYHTVYVCSCIASSRRLSGRPGAFLLGCPDVRGSRFAAGRRALKRGLWTFECVQVCGRVDGSGHVCTYVCMYICMYVCLYVCMHACMLACMYVCMYLCVYVCVYVCMYVCMSVCMHACMYVCMYGRMSLCARVCIYACMCAGVNA